MVENAFLELSALRDLCARYWNPIGVVMEFEPTAKDDPSPMPADEYDGYLVVMRRMIAEGASRHDVVLYLSKVEKDFIGLSQPSGDKAKFVEAVFALTQQ